MSRLTHLKVQIRGFTLRSSSLPGYFALVLKPLTSIHAPNFEVDLQYPVPDSAAKMLGEVPFQIIIGQQRCPPEQEMPGKAYIAGSYRKQFWPPRHERSYFEVETAPENWAKSAALAFSYSLVLIPVSLVLTGAPIDLILLT
ncbi:uncharacterized protein BDR25DRAFT_397584 [Lindgomyces ingoldianus]|uniref:Uncharacterized protein n=1 Tax=Lindgomyces ingoldianus TaxID=673940 RepID=A0ACB6Q7T5_9PLEO|nr:uncharacterized protein BDR25DRAFT_397584 [Lindgomyces ingoldianus]KAF2462477.1 hypothetical protein BDR25DRAFT_397584 [Lindgomyces ingoldianus]